MNSDIRLSIGWNRHPKIVKLRRKLGADGVLAIVNLWTFAGEQRPDGVLSGMDDDDIAIAAEYPGDSGLLVAALADLRLLERDGNDWKIHDWTENNPWAAGHEARRAKAKKAIQARWDRRNGIAPDPGNGGKNTASNTTSTEKDTTSIEKHASSNTPLHLLSISFPSPSPKEVNKTSVVADAPKKAAKIGSVPDGFARVKAVYPKRDGGQNWQQAQRAWMARRKEGHLESELLAGAIAYAGYIRRTGKEGTVYVKQAATFFGPDKHFLADWGPPASGAESGSLTGRAVL